MCWRISRGRSEKRNGKTTSFDLLVVAVWGWVACSGGGGSGGDGGVRLRTTLLGSTGTSAGNCAGRECDLEGNLEKWFLRGWLQHYYLLR